MSLRLAKIIFVVTLLGGLTFFLLAGLWLPAVAYVVFFGVGFLLRDYTNKKPKKN